MEEKVGILTRRTGPTVNIRRNEKFGIVASLHVLDGIMNALGGYSSVPEVQVYHMCGYGPLTGLQREHLENFFFLRTKVDRDLITTTMQGEDRLLVITNALVRRFMVNVAPVDWPLVSFRFDKQTEYSASFPFPTF